MISEEWLERDKIALAGVLPRCSNIVASHAKGSWITDVDGNHYLDFASGIAACSTGHSHPAIVEAIAKQAETLIHTSVVTHNTVNIKLAERLGELCPFFEEPQVFFSNSGAEAADGSLKLARYVTGKSGIIAFKGAFHGRTVAATSLTTAKGKYRNGYSPFLPYVYSVPYGGHLDILDETLSAGPPKVPYNIGAIIVEPVLGEGGYVVPPRDWLQALRDRCDGINRLLIFDEVQTGIGRTGHMWAAETFGVTPDVILFAKGIASGLPLGGIIASRKLMVKWPEGSHGSTFGGNPVSCSAALATLDIVEPLLPKVRERGEQTLKRLSSLQYPVRGIGFMIAIELPTAAHAEAVKTFCQTSGLIVLSCGPNDNVIRLIPPLNISESDLDWGLIILERVIGYLKI